MTDEISHSRIQAAKAEFYLPRNGAEPVDVRGMSWAYRFKRAVETYNLSDTERDELARQLG